MSEQRPRLSGPLPLLALTVLVFTALCAFGPAAVKVSWLTPTTHDFGDIGQGKPVLFSFRLRNDGTEPLVIENVRPACGCTTPDWPREAIAAGDTATITVTYNARTKGYFYKLVKVYFKGRSAAEKLYLEGYVL